MSLALSKLHNLESAVKKRSKNSFGVWSPMGYAPKSDGGLSNSLSPVNLHSSIKNFVWMRVHSLAINFLARIQEETRFSTTFKVCIEDLAAHIEDAHIKISRLG